ncbi:MAG TPA: amidase, partial [Parvularculaceae bacterium]|nr:amidase [Parvularculaceae bacterium]
MSIDHASMLERKKGVEMSMSRRRVMEAGAGGALAAAAAACARPDQAASNDLAELDAVETAARIKSGELSAKEAVDAAIERAARIDKKLNAIAFKTFDRAREEAGATQGPWAGVPSFVKDLDDIIGLPTGFGSRGFPGYKGKAQTPLIDSFLALGVVSLGKTTTPEFGLTATTEPASTGKTRNPWHTDYSTGGSSGGAAALVAAGVVPVAHASDGGGSIRIPASCCGNVGLKVSRGRHPQARPETAGPITISVHGVQSRTVRDTATAIASLEVGRTDPSLPDIGLVTGRSEKRLRIGYFVTGPYGRPVDPEVIEATKKVAALCEGLGHQVEEIALPYGRGIEEAFILYWAKNAAIAVGKWEEITGLKRNGLAFEKFTLGLIEHYEAHTDEFDAAVARLLAVETEFNRSFNAADVILSPVLAAPPVKLGYLDTGLSYEEHMARVADYAQFTGLYNIVGAPAISLPLSMSSAGLPIGAMFGAKKGEERTLLELAYELEEAA